MFSYIQRLAILELMQPQFAIISHVLDTKSRFRNNLAFTFCVQNLSDGSTIDFRMIWQFSKWAQSVTLIVLFSLFVAIDIRAIFRYEQSRLVLLLLMTINRFWLRAAYFCLHRFHFETS